jgi:hypothetical protein
VKQSSKEDKESPWPEADDHEDGQQYGGHDDVKTPDSAKSTSSYVKKLLSPCSQLFVDAGQERRKGRCSSEGKQVYDMKLGTKKYNV